MSEGDRPARLLIAVAATLCVAGLAAAVGLVATRNRTPRARSHAANVSSPVPSTTVPSPVAPTPAPKKRPPVDPLEDIDQDQLLQCIRATGALPGSHSNPDLTTLRAPRVVQLVADADESVRDLHFTKKIPFDLISQKEMDRRVIHMSLAGYTKDQAANDSQILAMLGAVPPATDLRSVAREALGGQVAGFYDDEKRKLVVGSSGASKLDPTEITTLAHELDHGLVDQALGFPALHDGSPLLADESLARHAVLEGDAVLDQTFFEFSYLSVHQQLQTSDDPAAKRADRQLARVPHYLTAGFLFPYTAGVNFACHLYLQGGWQTVDEAYFKPPVSSAQIMWPSRYEHHDRPVAPRASETPAGWQLAARTAIGAADLKALFEAPGDDASRALADPESRAAAWAGGRAELFRSNDQVALGIQLVQHRGSNDLCDSIRTWYRRAFPDAVVTATSPADMTLDGSGVTTVIGCSGDNVRVGIAPTLDVARDLSS
ncbi:MAG: hypothetical protein ABR579_07245 [Actinomycetota bacterium]